MGRPLQGSNRVGNDFGNSAGCNDGELADLYLHAGGACSSEGEGGAERSMDLEGC